MLNDEKLFLKLNETLKQNNLNLSIICVGGYVLSYYDLRETVDIDAFFVNDTKIEEIIKNVGEDLKANPIDELWLNNNVENLNESPSEDICDVIYEFSNLQVMIPPLAYIAGMKLNSMREEDIDDVALIIKKLQVDDIEEFTQELSKYGFNNIDEALITESFQRAYGIEWLEKYYIEHETLCLENVKKSDGFYDDKFQKAKYIAEIENYNFQLAYKKYKFSNISFNEAVQDIALGFMKEVVSIHGTDFQAIQDAVDAITKAENELPDFRAKLLQNTLKTEEYQNAFEKEQEQSKTAVYIR